MRAPEKNTIWNVSEQHRIEFHILPHICGGGVRVAGFFHVPPSISGVHGPEKKLSSEEDEKRQT